MDYDDQYADIELEQALKTSSESIYSFDHLPDYYYSPFLDKKK